MRNKDWTATEHDEELHKGKALSQTGILKKCPRCRELERALEYYANPNAYSSAMGPAVAQDALKKKASQ